MFYRCAFYNHFILPSVASHVIVESGPQSYRLSIPPLNFTGVKSAKFGLDNRPQATLSCHGFET